MGYKGVHTENGLVQSRDGEQKQVQTVVVLEPVA